MATQDEIQLVMVRLQSMPARLKLAFGGLGSFSKEELIQHVKDDDQVGELVIKAHMGYLRSFKQSV